MIRDTSRIPIGGLVGAVATLMSVITGPAPASASCPPQCASPALWTQPFSFAGFTWERKSGCGGPGPNCWTPANATPVAGEGVRLRLTRSAGQWFSAEIRTTAAVAHGGYSIQLVGRPDLHDPNVVLGVFLYDDAAGEAGDPCPDELDLESSRFGDPSAPNGHFVSYASGLCGPSDLSDFNYALTGTFTTHQVDWSPGVVSFRLMHGHRCAPESPDQLISERVFVSSLVPPSGGMRLHINLWAFAGNAPTDQQEVEVVIRDIVTTCAAVAAVPPPGPTGWALAARQNPSRGGVDLHFDLSADDHVRLAIFDVAGRRVATLVDGALAAGRHQARWDPVSPTPGVYFARLESGSRRVSRRFVLFE